MYDPERDDWPSADGHRTAEQERRRAFWRSFDFCVRHGDVAAFMAIYRPMRLFADLVAEADDRLAQMHRRSA